MMEDTEKKVVVFEASGDFFFSPGKMQPPGFGHAEQANFSAIFVFFVGKKIPRCFATTCFAVMLAVTTYIRTFFVQFSYHVRTIFANIDP